MSTVTLFCQEIDHSYRYHRASPERILNDIKEKAGVDINYINENIPRDNFTFSFSGNTPDYIHFLSQLFNRSITRIDKNVYVLGGPLSTTPSVPKKKAYIYAPDGEPLIGAAIWLPFIQTGTHTDADGAFLLEGYYDDDEIIECSYLGYQTKTLRYAELNNTPIYLASAEHQLSEIVITDQTRLAVQQTSQGAVDLTNLPLKKQAGVDVLQMAQLVPGVTSSSELLSDLQIRGGPPDQVRYEWNGIPIVQNSLFYGRISAINPLNTDRLTVHKNGTRVDQPIQGAGLIAAASRIGDGPTTTIKGEFDLLQVNLSGRFRFFKNRLRILTSVRQTHETFDSLGIYNNFYQNIFQFGKVQDDLFFEETFGLQDVWDINSKFEYRDFTFSTEADITKNTMLKFSYLNYGNELNYKIDILDSNDEVTDDFKITSVGYSAELNHRWSPQVRSHIGYRNHRYAYRYAFQEQYEDIEINQARRQENDLDQENINVTSSWIGRNLEVTAGASYSDFAARYLDTTATDGLYNFDVGASSEWNLFAEVEYAIQDKWLLRAGWRYSAYDKAFLGQRYWQPRFDVSYTINPQHQVHAHYGSFHSGLNRRNFVTPLQAENGMWYVSDASEGTENFIWVVQTDLLSAGYRYKRAGLQIDVEAYTKNISNLWTASFDFAVEEDPFTFGDVSVYGLELTAQYRYKKYHVLLGYELSDERITLNNGSGDVFPTPFQQPHRISLNQFYQTGRFSFNATWRFASGRPYSEAEYIDEVTGDDGNSRWILQYNGVFNRRVRNYHALDLAIQYRHPIKSKRNPNSNISITLRAFNFYNRENIIKNQYFIDYKVNPWQVGLLERRGLPATYNLSVGFEF